MKKYHYVYKIINQKPQDQRKYYIGVRSCDVLPEQDTQYLSSSKYLKQALLEIGHQYFIKEILSVWSTRTLANAEETRLHALFDVARNPEFYNMSKSTSSGFCTLGMVTVLEKATGLKKFITIAESKDLEKYQALHTDQVNVIDIKTGNKMRVSTKEFKNNPNYKNLLAGKVTALDTKTGIVQHVSKEEFDNNANLVGQLKGCVNVIDTRTGKGCSVSKEDFEKFDYFVHATKETMRVIDIRDGSSKRVPVEDYNKYDYFVSPNSKWVEIYDSNNVLQHRVFNAFKEYCEEHHLPFNAFSISKQNNGQTIYENSGSNKSKLEKCGYWKYKGWYAIDKHYEC